MVAIKLITSDGIVNRNNSSHSNISKESYRYIKKTSIITYSDPIHQ